MIALKLWPPIESLSEEGYVDPLRPDETPKGAAIESSNGPTEPAAEDPASLEKALGLVVKNGVHHRLHVHVETVKTCLGVLEVRCPRVQELRNCRNVPSLIFSLSQDQEIVEKIDIGDAADKDQIAEVLATASNTLNDLRALQVNRDEETAANDSGSPIQQSGASQCNKLQKLLEAAEKEVSCALAGNKFVFLSSSARDVVSCMHLNMVPGGAPKEATGKDNRPVIFQRHSS
eukprot:GHVU01127660.1.p1 GENE.GHVU01127660.1~~GHVU01127660.1.p1  ORF type:complete len:232 (+),score=25.75 GHVU01127660.1:187-882(+)